MMKKILFLAAMMIIASCGSQKEAVNKTTQPVKAEVPATPEPPKTPTLVNGHLSGLQSQDAFMQAPFAAWFTPRYEAYKLEDTMRKELQKGMKDVEIRAYMGTWCGDSKRETPMFYKILDEIAYNQDNLTMISVDRSKKQPVDLVEGYDIKRVPTFIFYREGAEIGRYVERPRESLAEDILKIVTGMPYKHSYDN